MSELSEIIVTPETRLAYVKDRLKQLRNDYIDEISTEILSGTGITHKCQKNWFHGVVGLLEMVQNIMKLNQQMPPDDFKDFIKKYTNIDFQKQTLVTPEDIAAGNRVLDLAIEGIEKIK